MNGGEDSPVGRQEWGGTLGLLEEIRLDIKDDIKELKRGQSDLSRQLAETDRRITSRQEVANGRTTTNEQAVAAAVKQVEAVSEQVEAVQKIVASIKKNGCEQKEKHVEVSDALVAAGVVPDTSEVIEGAAPGATRWTRHHKAGLGVVGISGLGLGALLPHVGPFLHWVATLLEKGVKP